MFGKRHDLVDDILALEAGEYGKDSQGKWWCRPPGTGLIGNLSGHDVIEHADGTITVSPSILCEGWDEQAWHGWLIKGIWTEA